MSKKLEKEDDADEDDSDLERQFYSEEAEGGGVVTSSSGPSTIRSRRGDLFRDQDEWETSLLVRSGAASIADGSKHYQASTNRARVTVRASRPTFQMSKNSFFGGSKTHVVDVVKDRNSDLSKTAERGSQVLKDWREKTLKAKMRQKYWELGGSEMGKAIGDKTEEKYMDDEQEVIDEEEEEGEKNEIQTKVNQELPINKVLPDLLRAVRENQIVVIVGETGSGKTTRLPISLLRDGSYPGIVACTQPRRVAAMSVAKRVADECGCPVGGLVGYSIRFEDCTTKETRVKYMTDGVLLRESLHDSELEKYSVVVMDEAHERSLNTDVLFGINKRVVRKRRDFRLVVTSATLDAEKFSLFFGGCAIFRIPGRTFKVENYFSKQPVVDYVDAAVKQILQIHLTLPPGDILVFLTGQDDITCCCELVAEKLGEILTTNEKDEKAELDQKRKLSKSKLLLLPMYSTLPSDLQSKIFDPANKGQRKCVVSTNVAETSLTVEGIRYVVDCGYTKTKVFNPRIGMDSLRLIPVSQAAANQRSGRAGRTAEGYCYRLFTELQFKEEMFPMAVPEIQRTNLGAVILLLKSLGVDRTLDFEFMDPPPTENLLDSLNQLWVLGAVDENGNLTALGRKMVEFPLDPALSKMVIVAEELSCTSEIITIVSMLSVPDVFFRPPDRAEEADQARERLIVPESDHLTLVNVYNMWIKNDKSSRWCSKHFIHFKAMRKAFEVREQLTEVMKKSKMNEIIAGPTRWDMVRKCICSSYFANSAVLKGISQYVNLLNGIPCFLHPSSGLFGLGYTPEYVVYHELMITTKEWMRHVTAVEAEWLAELGPIFFSLGDTGDQPKRTTSTISSAIVTPTTSNEERIEVTKVVNVKKTPSSSSTNAIQAAREKRDKKLKRSGWGADDEND